eukprot:snap_masked-scaffold_5-processed-gene-4.9-mRNA-1 protein AED:1.00 eAED:1.00 QI:0/0/0/0/1/1/3/0/278
MDLCRWLGPEVSLSADETFMFARSNISSIINEGLILSGSCSFEDLAHRTRISLSQIEKYFKESKGQKDFFILNNFVICSSTLSEIRDYCSDCLDSTGFLNFAQTLEKKKMPKKLSSEVFIKILSDTKVEIFSECAISERFYETRKAHAESILVKLTKVIPVVLLMEKINTDLKKFYPGAPYFSFSEFQEYLKKNKFVPSSFIEERSKYIMTELKEKTMKNEHIRELLPEFDDYSIFLRNFNKSAKILGNVTLSKEGYSLVQNRLVDLSTGKITDDLSI